MGHLRSARGVSSGGEVAHKVPLATQPFPTDDGADQERMQLSGYPEPTLVTIHVEEVETPPVPTLVSITRII